MKLTLPSLLLLIALVPISLAAGAQANNNYTQTNLVSNVPGLALTLDTSLDNPWGLAGSANQPFRIALNGKGKFESYNGSGVLQDPRGVIGVPDGVTAPANPTGVVSNTTGEFTSTQSPLPLPFIFATRQGTISGEYADSQGDIKTTTILTFDHSAQGAEYTGLALLTPDCCAPYLAAADFHRGYVETITALFDPLGIPGAFTDPNLPAGFSPWNLQVVGNHVFVAYALQDIALHDPLPGPGGGFVDVYNLDGSFVKRFASTGVLNVPTAIVQASANFGAFSNDILIGNFGDGAINAFDPNTGQFVGTLKDGNGNPITNPQLHSMFFGNGTVGSADTLYLTANPAGGTSGIFAAVAVNTSGAGPDFVLSSDRQSVTVTPGQIGDFSVKAAPVGNYRGAFTFTCNAPAGVTCNVSAPSMDPATGAAVVAVTAKTSGVAGANTTAGSNPGPQVQGTLRQTQGRLGGTLACLLPGFLLAGIGWRRRRRFLGWMVVALGVLGVASVGLSGCGGGGAKMAPGPTAQTFTITATSGSVSHSTMLTLNVQ
ncbi:MAG: TIGR03118 family protein [Acidobacteria bacterium]|nr:TIGR03118 family protein [Acidobacteriota bacterium]